MIRNIKVNFKHKIVDLVSLSQLINSDWLDDLEPSSAIPKSITSSGQGILRLEFTARKRSFTTTLYQVNSFPYWGNLTHRPSKMVYAGPKYLIYNSSSNCVKGVTLPSQHFLSDSCSVENYEDSRLSLWRKEFSVDTLADQEMSTSLLVSYPHVYVYCYMLRITVGTETRRCPPYVFKMNATMNWNTSDHTYIPLSMELAADTKYLQVESNIHHVHFRNESHLIDENIALDRVDTLNRELKELKAKNIALELPMDGGGMSYAFATRALLSSTLSLVVVLPLAILYFVYFSKKNHRKIRATVQEGIYGSNYETIGKVNHTPSLPANLPTTIVNISRE